MLLNLRELQAFLAVVDHGSLGKAAEALHLSQPALSRIVHRLEEQVGVPLLERHQKGATMTAYGVQLERYARLLLSESARAVQELEAMQGAERGVVRFGAVTSALSSFVPATVERFLSQSPGLQATIVEGLTEELLSQLARGHVDLALTFEVPTADDIEVVSQSEWQEGCHIVTGATHPLRGREDLVLRELLDHRWALVPRGTQPREQLRHLFTTQGLVAPAATVESGSIALLRRLVARGGFLGWMPRPLIEHGDNSDGPVHILPVQAVQTTRRYALYRRRDSALSPATRALLEDLLAAIRSLHADHAASCRRVAELRTRCLREMVDVPTLRNSRSIRCRAGTRKGSGAPPSLDALARQRHQRGQPAQAASISDRGQERRPFFEIQYCGSAGIRDGAAGVRWRPSGELKEGTACATGWTIRASMLAEARAASVGKDSHRHFRGVRREGLRHCKRGKAKRPPAAKVPGANGFIQSF